MLEKIRNYLPSRQATSAGLIGVVIGVLIIGGVAMLKPDPLALSDEGKGITITWLPETVTRWKGPIEEMGKRYNLDPNLIAIIMTLESGGWSQANSEADAQGLMQVTPPTAGDIAKRYLKKPVDTYNLFDARTNIEFGTAYLALIRNEFTSKTHAPTWNETVELIAAGYNGGFGASNNLEQGKGLTDTETVVYSRDAFNMWRERNAPNSPTYERWLERGGSALIERAQEEQ